MKNKVITILRNIRRNLLCYKTLLYDVYIYQKHYSDSAQNIDSKSYYEREIMVLAHTIEKGFSHKKIKPLFGKATILKLIDYVKKYEAMEKYDVFILNFGKSIIKKYIEENKKIQEEYDFADWNIHIYSDEFCKNVGAYKISKEDYFQNKNADFNRLAASRHSVRLYDSKSDIICEEKLENSIKVAMESPSACNRQAVRVKVVKDNYKIKCICEIQKGSNGFGQNAGILLIITVDIRYYISAERRLPMFDAGLFSMNLVNALYQNEIGSCILNGSFTKEQETQIREVIDIPEYEMISSLIVLSNIPEEETVMIPFSPKQSYKSIVSVYE